MKYSFDEKNHKHYLDDKLLAGVTTVLKTINPVSFDEEGNIQSKTDMLMSWAVKLAVEEASKIDWSKIKGKEKELEIKRCKAAHRQTRDASGDYGKMIHSEIENYIKTKKYNAENEDVKSAVEYLIKYITANNFEIIENEKHIYSEKIRVGGILDLLLKQDNKYYIADIKTSKNWYNEMFWQMGAYDICLKENENIDVSGYIIIHLPKTKIYTIVDECNTAKCQEAFRAALTIYRISLGQV
jgi:hypothetical protein